MERRVGTEEERTPRPTGKGRVGLVRKLTRGGTPRLLLLGQKRRASQAKLAGSRDGTGHGASDVLRDGGDSVGWECPAGTGSGRDPGDIGPTISASNTRINGGESGSTGGEPLPRSCPSLNGPLSRVTGGAGEAGQGGGSRQRGLRGARASWGALICVRKPRERGGDEAGGRSPRESQGQPGGGNDQGVGAGGRGNGARPPGTGVCGAGAKPGRRWASFKQLVAPRKERRGSAGKGAGGSGGGGRQAGGMVPGDPQVSPVGGEEQGWTDPPGHQETGAPGWSGSRGGAVGTVPAEGRAESASPPPGWESPPHHHPSARVGAGAHAEGALGNTEGPLQGETTPPVLGATVEVSDPGMEQGNPDEAPPVPGDGSLPQLGLAPMSLAKQGGMGGINGPEGFPIEDLIQGPTREAPGLGRSSTGELGSSAKSPGQVLTAGAGPGPGSSVPDLSRSPALAPDRDSLPAPSRGEGAAARDPRPWQRVNGNGAPAEGGGAGWGGGPPGQDLPPEAALHRVARCVVRRAVEAAVAQVSAETAGSCDPHTPSSSAFHPGTLPQWDHSPHLPLGSHSQPTPSVLEVEGADVAVTG